MKLVEPGSFPRAHGRVFQVEAATAAEAKGLVALALSEATAPDPERLRALAAYEREAILQAYAKAESARYLVREVTRG
jgi:hypothetical protein